MKKDYKKVAIELLSKIGLSYPEDLEDVAKILNLKIIYKNFEDNISGMLIIKKSGSVIGVNETHPWVRQRFSIAHEIGHYLLHGEEEGIFIDSSIVYFRDKQSSGNIKEIQANRFAAELLMPEDYIREKFDKHKLPFIDSGFISKLARELDVSESALGIRLSQLNLVSL